MKISLDKGKAGLLQCTINSTKYSYMDAKRTASEKMEHYFKLCAVLDRLEECVEILNEIDLDTDRWHAENFVLWVGYADLLTNCLRELEKEFTVTMKDRGLLFKYHNIVGQKDYNFFRFIRAMILPHAVAMLETDFSNGGKAYSPFVRWEARHNGEHEIKIAYYTKPETTELKKLMINTKYYSVKITDIMQYITEEYNSLTDIIVQIEKVQKSRRLKVMRKTAKITYDKNASLEDKIKVIDQAEREFGDVDRMRGVGLVFEMLEKCQRFLKITFDPVNEEAINEYKGLINQALDEAYESIVKQEIPDYIALAGILSPHICPVNRKTDFQGDLYDINKIVSELTNNTTLDWSLKKTASSVAKYMTIKEGMAEEELVFINIIAAFKDKLKHEIETKELVNALKKRSGV